MMQDDPRIPGWFGKMPSLGDFASRRLPPEFVSCWDGWLQAVIPASREQLGPAWLDAYLTSPLWRYLLLPGVCGDATWIGVLMPSVDKVGRYFPLTVAVELRLLPHDPAHVRALSDWFDGIETAALATLDASYSAQQFESALASSLLPCDGDPDGCGQMLARQLAQHLLARGGPSEAFTLQAVGAMPGLLASAAVTILQRAASGNTLWWSHRHSVAAPVLLCCHGLPGSRDFASMLRGLAAN